MGTWRRAYGALKDSTRVGIAKFSSEFKELDIAIVKATNHEECPPKERHVRRIFTSISVARPRADIAYCIYALAKRLAKTRDWVVAVKALIVIHRLLREGDPSFKEELLKHSQRGQILQMSNFKDDSSPFAWDCSAWVRTYALFLAERLECFGILKYDIEAERLLKNVQGASKGHSRTRTLSCPDLLEQMPAIQQLLRRLVGCQPEGAAFGNNLIQYALALVIKESFRIYCAVNDGIINLVDMFFEMSKYDAIKALEVYKIAGQQAENLSEFYDYCKNLELARNFQFPTLRQPPPSFLATMEEYISEAPCMSSISSKNLEYQEENILTYKEDEHAAAIENTEPSVEEVKEEEEVLEAEKPLEITEYLLDIKEMRSTAAEIEHKNALALAVMQPGDGSRITSTDLLSGNSGWELALVSTPSNNVKNVVESKLAGGFDMLLLDSLYEDASRRQQIAGGTYIASFNASSYESRNPFTISSDIAPPTNDQMTLMAQHPQQQQYYYHHHQQQQQQFYDQQQRQFYYQQQQMPQHYQQQQMPQHYQQQLHYQQQQMMMLLPYGRQTQNYHLQVGPTNPFSFPFTEFSQNAPSEGNSSLI